MPELHMCYSTVSYLMTASIEFSLLHTTYLLLIAGAYEPPKEHETQFHDYPNYVTVFENSVYVICGFW